ncbi:HAD family hydrolase [Cohnella luojiensis]|uniref:HAD family hydrolase n=1 Tax=Cohnella luojiensis TaxID=652876 RepID=A0A4Y8LPG7_9BACL|nr:HAD family hydrolase [Cohnella luojiensis]TFE19662.1 HAD family hydrolase [Cohnella luojiensis]
MDKIKAVIFDLDNTILDRMNTFRNFAASFVSFYFEQHDLNDSFIKRIIELDQDGYKDKNELFSELLEELPWGVKPQVAELLEYYSINYVSSAILMEQAREVVQSIRKTYKTGLITNGKTAIQYGKIDRLGIRNDFDFIIVSEEAGVKKPNPKIFEMACMKLELSPDQCVYIGDHPVNDIEGAAKAGMETIWIQVNQPWKAEVTVSPRHVIKKLNELLEILKCNGGTK